MKKLLLILFAIVSLGNMLHAAEDNNPVEIVLQQTDNNDEIKEIPDKEEQSPIRRSLQQQIAYAYIYNKVVSIDFNATIENATVTVTNTATGETVYFEAYSNPVTLSIDLNGENSGSYLIEIEADGTLLTGEFIL